MRDVKNEIQALLDLCPKLLASLESADRYKMERIGGHLEKVKAVYGLFDGPKCVYIGRTRDLAARLRGHKARSTYSASFAVSKARKASNNPKNYKPGNSARALLKNDNDNEFARCFDEARSWIKHLKFSFVEVPSKDVQYIFEFYATHAYGLADEAFETH